MNLPQKLEVELNRVQATLDVCGKATFSIKEDNNVISAEMSTLQPLACALLSLKLETPALADTTAHELRQISGRLSRQLSYLLEPVRLVECDDEHCVVQMRSSPPSRDENRRSYYELTLQRGGSIELRRFTKAAGTSRQAIPAYITREVLYRLAGDMIAVARVAKT